VVLVGLLAVQAQQLGQRPAVPELVDGPGHVVCAQGVHWVEERPAGPGVPRVDDDQEEQAQAQQERLPDPDGDPQPLGRGDRPRGEQPLERHGGDREHEGDEQ